MALIKCSECGKEISDKAKLCPHCGFDYLFIPTTIETFGYLKCNVCGKEIKFSEW